MSNFDNQKFKEISFTSISNSNVIKSESLSLKGITKIHCNEDDDAVKILLKKDSEESVKEIVFICSCGKTKSVLLSYNEE